MRSYVERQDDWLLPNDLESDPEDEDAFNLSQSSVVDEMTTDEALAIMGEADNYAFKDDRKRLICDLKNALSGLKK
jgi:hypothetical protein